MIWFLILTLSSRWTIIASEKCFKKFEEDGKCFCSCDFTVHVEYFPTLPYEQAFMLCSWKCSQANNCKGFNFWKVTHRCQLFNQPLKKFSIVFNCSYYHLKGFQTYVALQIYIF